MEEPEWREVALDTLRFVERSMRLDDGYATSLDADADGVEGSHITWTAGEVSTVLNDHGLASDLSDTLARWRIERSGAFEGRSIPRLADGEAFAVPDHLARAHHELVRARARRVQPGRDEKVILEWNAMLASAFLRSDEGHFVSLGEELLASLRATHFAEDTWWRTAHRQAHATCADLAWLISAEVDAFEQTGNDEWLDDAELIAHYLLQHFWDGPIPNGESPHVGQGVFTQSDRVSDLTLRPKEIFDGATPSAHAVTTEALARLGLVLGDIDLLAVAQRLVELAGSLLVAHPGAVVDLAEAAGYAVEGVEVVVPGDSGILIDHVRSMYMPRSVVITGTGRSPLLEGREVEHAYVCRAGVCAMPVTSVDTLDQELKARITWPS